MMNDNTALVLERTYDVPAYKVWKALTDVDDIRKWYFDLADFKAEIGFEFRFTAGDDKVQFEHACRVTQVEVGKKIAYTWGYPAYPGESEVSFELFAMGNQTKVVITHTGLETFPADSPNFARSSFSMGWTHFLGTLEKFLHEKTW